MPTYAEYALEVNLELGGQYVSGILTPPATWTGSTTEWTRYVQAETAKRAAGMTFTPLSQHEIDVLHYGGYPAGSDKANEYIWHVEASGWVWSVDHWIRKDTGYIYIEPEPTSWPEPTPTPAPAITDTIIYPAWQEPTPTPTPPPATTIYSEGFFGNWLMPFTLCIAGLYAVAGQKSKIMKKLKKRRK